MSSSREIRAVYDAETITVYQAYRPEIADAAVAAGRFVPPFRRERMTWIKPSFLWMMYRSGWATKPGQERILEIRMRRDGFEWALARACPSSYERGAYSSRAAWQRALRESPVRVQWDPERDRRLQPIAGRRSLQLGLGGEAAQRYADEWTVAITDITGRVHRIRDGESLPDEREYEVGT